jgi:hypothetical protein
MRYGGFVAQLYGSRLEVRRSDVTWGANIVAVTGSTALIEDCVLRAEQSYTFMEVDGYDGFLFNMTNTTLVGAVPTSIVFSPFRGAEVLLDGCTLTNVTVHIRPDAPSWMLGNISANLTDCTFAGDCAYLVVLDVNHVDQGLYEGSVTVHLEGCAFSGPGTGVAMQRGTSSGWDGLALEDGAMVLTFRPMRIDLPSSPPRYNAEVVGDLFLPPFMEVPPFRNDYGDPLFEGHILAFDIVDGDPPPGAPGTTATLVIDSNDEVVWFEEVALVGETVYVEVPEWERIGNVVTSLRSDILAGIDWWT